MNRTIKGLITLFALIMVCLIGYMAYLIISGEESGGFFVYESKLVNTTSIPMEQIEDIKINYNSDDVILYESDSDEIIIKEYMVREPKEGDFATITSDGTKLKISAPEKRRTILMVGIIIGSNYAEVYIPSNFSGNLEVTTQSGYIEAKDYFDLKSSQLTSKSGDVNIEGITVEDIGVTTSSGEIYIKEITGKHQLTTKSGDIRIDSSIGDNQITTSSGTVKIGEYNGIADISSSSGDIILKEGEGDTGIETSSGTVQLKYKNTVGNLKISSSSGDVNVAIPSDTELNFNASTSSGDIHTFFDQNLNYDKKGKSAEGTLGTNPTMEIQIKTSSGGIKVKEL